MCLNLKNVRCPKMTVSLTLRKIKIILDSNKEVLFYSHYGGKQGDSCTQAHPQNREGNYKILAEITYISAVVRITNFTV